MRVEGAYSNMDADTVISNRFQDHFARIDEELEKTLSSRVPLIQDMGNHSLLGRGKRLRPLLFVLSCHLCNYDGGDLYRLSTIFEYIHTASLLHDDVLDNAEVRRRKPSANHVWGNHAAVLEGDFLYSKSISLALGANNLTFLKRLTDTTTRMAEGQILELLHSHNWGISKDQYMDIITSKTAVLISAACACGAIASDAEESAVNHLAQFGLNMGIAFQLMDDLFDYISSERELGKPVGKDLKEGKVTLPLIYTIPNMETSEVKRLAGLFKNQKACDEDYRTLIGLVRNNGVIDRIRSEAQVYVDKAAVFLDSFPRSPMKENLMKLNDYIIHRSY